MLNPRPRISFRTSIIISRPIVGRSLSPSAGLCHVKTEEISTTPGTERTPYAFWEYDENASGYWGLVRGVHNYRTMMAD